MKSGYRFRLEFSKWILRRSTYRGLSRLRHAAVNCINMEWRNASFRGYADENSSQSASSEYLFSGFVCIDLNAIAGRNMRIREHLEFDESV
jgi:hypothetical protein